MVASTLLLALMTACSGQSGGVGLPSGPSVTSTSVTSAPEDGDWPTYHRDPARTGVAAAVPPVGKLARAWTAALDGAVYGQPLVIGDTVVAATEGDTVYALDRATGKVRWQRHLGTPVPLSELPCGNIDPLGITGTPVYDPGSRRVFVVAETTGFRHVLFGLGMADGRVEVQRDLPAPDGNPRNDQQRAALLLTRGRIYVAFGGLLGDCGQYVGAVVGVPVSGQGDLVSYKVPTSRMGAIWGTGGPTLGAEGTIYVSVGNGQATSGDFDGSDSVTALTPDLQRTAVFAPRTWAADNADDLDLGSMSPALIGTDRLLAVGKRGTAYLLRRPELGGVGGQITQADACPAYGGPAVDGTTAYLPCSGGLAAVSVAHDQINVLWRGPKGAQGSPVLGGGAVWAVDWDAGTLYALDRLSGQVRQQIDTGTLPHFASPTLSGTLVLLGTMHGVIAITGA
jgi:outer membrane protein assembly factor BamB